MSQLNIRPATEQDIDLILHFVRELAIYEKAEDEAKATPEHIRRTLFCEHPAVFGLICEVEGKAIGFAVYFFSYSTWLGKHGIYLEDLYVAPEYRKLGAGKALLQHLAQLAVAKGCGRLEWAVLDWNTPAIEFYESFGARPKDDWISYRLTGQALLDFAAG